MAPPLSSVLDAAAAELTGQLMRTNASVIGHNGGESLVVAETGWGYTVTAMLQRMRIAFTVEPRGWLRRSLRIEGTPIELVHRVVDGFHQERILQLAPLGLELGPASLRVEYKYGTDITAAIHLAVSLARRARHVQTTAGKDARLQTA